MKQVTAVVLAGSRPGGDSFAQAYGAELKALIPIGGMPMVRRPVEALLASEHVGRIRVLAQQPDRIRNAVPADPRVMVEQSGETIAATLEAFCFDPDMQWPMLVTTADHALLTPEMIADFLARADGADIAIGVVSRDALLKRLPQTQRTWLKFRGGAYSGANLFLLGGPRIRSTLERWRSSEQNRKKGWRLFSAMGPLLLVGALLRLVSLAGAARRLGRKLGLDVRPVLMANPLAAVDVDKPADHALVEALLAGRA